MKDEGMTTRRRAWEERHRRAAERTAVRVRVDRCHVAPLGRRGYSVRLEGFNLHPAISPPRITVGGIRLEEPRFEPKGRAIEGILRRKPRSERVVVDYGFARAEMRGIGMSYPAG